MQTSSQTEFLNKVEQQLETQLQEVISIFQNLPEDAHIKPSSSNGWSIAECIAHLNTYAEFYNPRIKEAISKSPMLKEPGVFKHSFLGKYFINSMDSSKSKKKFKALKRHKPVEIGNPDRVVSIFIQHLEKMLDLLKQARLKDLRKNSLKTSISPWLKINSGDALQFLLTHNKRHLEQAKRNL